MSKELWQLMRKDKAFQKWCFDTDLVGNKDWFNLEDPSGDEVFIAYEAWQHQEKIIDAHVKRRMELAEDKKQLVKKVDDLQNRIESIVEESVETEQFLKGQLIERNIKISNLEYLVDQDKQHIQSQQKRITELQKQLNTIKEIMNDYYTGSYDESAEMAGLISLALDGTYDDAT